MASHRSQQTFFTENNLVRQAEASIPTPYGTFLMIAFSERSDEYAPHFALVHPDMDPGEDVVVRVHSECVTGDLFGSKRCDCGEQLDHALRRASTEKGILIYLRQEGRGIGIINKLKAYELQDTGLDTIQANVHLGLEVDARQYGLARDILQQLGVKSIRLMTNNPEKLSAFEEGPVRVAERLPIVIKPVEENQSYLDTKEQQMGHLFK